MRIPLRQKSKLARGQSSATQSIPAPVGGWNARDALADMPATDAVVLENWFPRTSSCDIRGGYSDWATGMTGNGKTLAAYNPLSGSNKLYCYTASGIYDVTTAGAVGASKLARTNGKHIWTAFGDGSSNWLIAVNGVDKPAYFDGTTWTAVDNATTPALTGLTTTSIAYVNAFKGRLFFLANSSLNFYYLAAGSAGGALTAFSLNGEATRGGYLMAMGTLTIDAGDGPDDRAVFVTSEGEVIVYQGTNPSSAASWTKVGAFYVGRPIGRRCLCKFGGDLVILTQNGAFPLTKALQSNVIDNKEALSFKIENAFNEASKDYFSVFGWKAIVFPKQSALIVNIPIAEDGAHQQYVMNTITKAWCKFTGWNAEDFAVLDNDLYFSVGTKVVKAWIGESADGTSDVVAYGKPAFSHFGRRGVQKQVKMFRPVLSINGTATFLTGVDVDYQERQLTGTTSYTPSSVALWGTAIWGVSLWGSGEVAVKQWTSPSCPPGYAATGKIKMSNRTLSIRWLSCDYVFEIGGPM